MPSENQFIAKIVKPKGNNLHQVIDEKNKEFLVSMPRKFRNIVFVRRGNFVLVDPIEEGNKVRGEIHQILDQESIKHFIEEKIWPEGFHEDTLEIYRQLEKKSDNTAGYEMDLPPMSSDEEEESDDEFQTCNPNRYT